VADEDPAEREPDRDFYVVCNAWIDPVEFRIPLSPSGRHWRRAIDSYQKAVRADTRDRTSGAVAVWIIEGVIAVPPRAKTE